MPPERQAASFATKIRHLEKGEMLAEGQAPADYAHGVTA